MASKLSFWVNLSILFCPIQKDPFMKWSPSLPDRYTFSLLVLRTMYGLLDTWQVMQITT